MPGRRSSEGRRECGLDFIFVKLRQSQSLVGGISKSPIHQEQPLSSRRQTTFISLIPTPHRFCLRILYTPPNACESSGQADIQRGETLYANDILLCNLLDQRGVQVGSTSAQSPISSFSQRCCTSVVTRKHKSRYHRLHRHRSPGTHPLHQTSEAKSSGKCDLYIHAASACL